MPDRARVFELHRSLLQGIAYRMTGTLAEAEDIVQETWLKWNRATETGAIQNARAWLVTVCSRLALDVLKSARVQREQYCGVWLPEPFHEVQANDPAADVAVDETISMALMLALEKLTPSERAAFLLHDVFACSFDEIARILGKSSASCRKLASRARTSVQAEKPRFTASAEEHRRLLDAFLQAAYAGDLDTLKSLLAGSVEMRSDGGGKVEALPEVMQGVKEIADFLVRVLHRRPGASADTKRIPCRINGTPGVLIYEAGLLVTALTTRVEDGRIQQIYAVRNPDKLRRLESQLSALRVCGVGPPEGLDSQAKRGEREGACVQNPRRVLAP